ncbi:MAG: M23 family metallopeptidase [Archangiaceae bacterium]|nr:M23 family metallopeptidase [Archangiaceae bacterium]
MKRWRFGLALLVLSLCACPSQGNSDKKPPAMPTRDGPLGVRRCSAEAGRKNPRRPVFNRPFEGEYPVFNMFDHQTPGEFRPVDSASNELSYCGIDMLGLAEGFEGYSWGLPLGTPVLAVADGEVIHAGLDDEFFCLLPEFRKSVDNQLSVHVKHEGLAQIGYVTIYQHLKWADVKVGDKVTAGQRLGLSGQSGCATEPLFYFGVVRLTGTKTGRPTSVDAYGWDGPRTDPWVEKEKGAQSYYLWRDGEAPKLGGRVR